MELKEIIVDALHYPLKDFDKFFYIGLFNLIIMVFTSVLALNMFTTNDFMYYTPPMYMVFLFLFFIVAIIIGLILSGISLDVIRKTIKNDNDLPTISLKNNIVDGLKYIIVAWAYVFIPTIIYTVLVVLFSAMGEDIGVIFIILFTIVYLVAIVIISFLLVVAQGRLAETDSMGEAISIKNVFELTKKIGFVKIFLVMLVAFIVMFVISLIGGIISFIPVVGNLINALIFSTFSMLFIARVIGLLYREAETQNISYDGNDAEEDKIRNMDDLNALAKIARTDRHKELRMAAVERMGQLNSKDNSSSSGVTASSTESTSVETKPQVVNDKGIKKLVDADVPLSPSMVCDVCSQSLDKDKAWFVPNNVFYSSQEYREYFKNQPIFKSMGVSPNDPSLERQLKDMERNDTSPGSAVCTDCIHLFANESELKDIEDAKAKAEADAKAKEEAKAVAEINVDEYIQKVANTGDPLVIDGDYEAQKEYDALKEKGDEVVNPISTYLKNFASLDSTPGCPEWYYGGHYLVRLLGDIGTEKSIDAVGELFNYESKFVEWYDKIIAEAAEVLGKTGDKKWISVLNSFVLLLLLLLLDFILNFQF